MERLLEGGGGGLGEAVFEDSPDAGRPCAAPAACGVRVGVERLS